MIADNCWYGHRRVLADYCGLANERPIYGHLVHGWYEDIPAGMGRSRFVNAPVFFWNMRHVEQASRVGLLRPRCVGAPFVYAVRNLGIEASRTGQGTLVFHAHSAERIRVAHDLTALAYRVMEVAEPPYTLVVYYQDQSPEIDDWCAKAGWRSVTFGDRADRRFLYRAALEIGSHEAVITEGFQTASWYGAYLGRTVQVVATTPPNGGMQLETVDEVGRDARHVLMGGVGGADAVRMATTELAADRVMSPQDLARELGWLSLRRQVKARTVQLAADVRFGRAARQGQLSDRVVSHLSRREQG